MKYDLNVRGFLATRLFAAHAHSQRLVTKDIPPPKVTVLDAVRARLGHGEGGEGARECAEGSRGPQRTRGLAPVRGGSTAGCGGHLAWGLHTTPQKRHERKHSAGWGKIYHFILTVEFSFFPFNKYKLIKILCFALFCRDCPSFSSRFTEVPVATCCWGCTHVDPAPTRRPSTRRLAACKRACKLPGRIPLPAPSKHESWMKPTPRTMPSEQEGPWAPQRPSRAHTQDIACGAAVTQTPVPKHITRGRKRTTQRKADCMSVDRPYFKNRNSYVNSTCLKRAMRDCTNGCVIAYKGAPAPWHPAAREPPVAASDHKPQARALRPARARGAVGPGVRPPRAQPHSSFPSSSKLPRTTLSQHLVSAAATPCRSLELPVLRLEQTKLLQIQKKRRQKLSVSCLH